MCSHIEVFITVSILNPPLAPQMFKGFHKAKDIQYVYTPVFSSLCGVKLDSNNKAGYLLSGKCGHLVLAFSVKDCVRLTQKELTV